MTFAMRNARGRGGYLRISGRNRPAFPLLPPGEGGAKRRMRVRRSGDGARRRANKRLMTVPAVDLYRFAVPSPQPLSRWERGFKNGLCGTAANSASIALDLFLVLITLGVDLHHAGAIAEFLLPLAAPSRS